MIFRDGCVCRCVNEHTNAITIISLLHFIRFLFFFCIHCTALLVCIINKAFIFTTFQQLLDVLCKPNSTEAYNELQPQEIIKKKAGLTFIISLFHTHALYS